MIKTLILLLCFQVSIDVVANDADLNRATNIVTFPRVTVDKTDVYNNVELLLSPTGSWEILATHLRRDKPLFVGWAIFSAHRGST